MLRTRAFALAIAGALLVPLAGCGSSQPVAAPSTPASPAVPPAQLLAAAVAKTRQVSLAMVLAGDTASENVTGTYDAAHKLAALAQGTGGDRLKILVSADEMYLSGLSDFAGKTMRLHIAKLATSNPIALFADPLAPFTLLDAATGVQATSPTAFAGKLDVAKAQGATIGSRKFLAFLLKLGGTRTGSVDFVASVDAQGYLTAFKATFPGINDGKDGEYDVALSDFGKPVTNKKPTGRSVIEAPAQMYAQS
jgi:hypothetical protein